MKKPRGKLRPEIFDYSEGDEETIVLIVRPKNTYGAAKAGERVRVSIDESQNPSTKTCLMSEQERDDLAAERARRAKAKTDKPRRDVKGIVEAGLERLRTATPIRNG